MQCNQFEVSAKFKPSQQKPVPSHLEDDEPMREEAVQTMIDQPIDFMDLPELNPENSDLRLASALSVPLDLNQIIKPVEDEEPGMY